MALADCALAGLTSCAPERRADTSEDEVRAALASIATAAGTSALDRMQACGLQIDWSASWISIMPLDVERAEVKAGDRVLQVRFIAPNPPGQSGGRSSAEASWRFRAEAPMPTDNWATRIQQKAPLIGSDVFLNC